MSRGNARANNSELTEKQVLAEIAERVAALGGIRAASRAWECSASYLCAVLGGQRRPGPSVLRPNHFRQVERRYVRER